MTAGRERDTSGAGLNRQTSRDGRGALSVPEDTIAAISTPPGEGGIGIVRVSGREAIELVSRVFHSSSGRDITGDRGPVFHGEIRDGDAVLDEVLVHVMRAPRSYTREDVVEVNCHGGFGPLNAILELALREGARLAEPGEFTKRAFVNGRIDLVQAEAVIDRIRAQSRAGLQAAAAAANGALSNAINDIRETLTQAMGRIEAAVDFPEDDLPELIDASLREAVEDALARMRNLYATADAGRLYREGAAMAIVGRPNVGKSSLFNALVRDARAIVTAQPGTTRDILEEVVNLSGIPVRFLDTAGFRATEDEVERIGVETARAKLNTVAAALLVLDSSESLTRDDHDLAAELRALDIPVVLVLNKSDLAPDARPPNWDVRFEQTHAISATTGKGLRELEDGLAKLLLDGAVIAPDQGMITRLHQKDSLRRAMEATERLHAGLDAGQPELLSIDMQDALHALGEITGETTPDDVLERVFASFCIGK